MIFEKDYRDFLQLLNQHEVDYLLIGGYAMIAYDEPRYTKDMDIFIRPDEKNAVKIIQVLNEFGFDSLNLTKEDFLSDDLFIQLGVAPVRIDLTSNITGVSFDEAYANRIITDVNGMKVPVIGILELIKNKMASGRIQDLADADRLKKISNLKKGEA